jgi:hypothetical protein
MAIELTNETRQTFGGRVLKQGQRVKARMSLNSADENGEDWREEERECEAYVSRIENDVPLFIAINPYKNRTLAIRQMGMRFVEPGKPLPLWSWTWLPEDPIASPN